MRYQLKAFFGCVALATLSGCAHQYYAEGTSSPYGFFSGLWHGFIFLFSLVGCIFFDSVHLIGKPNTGFGYGVGYAFGLMAALGGGSGASR